MIEEGIYLEEKKGMVGVAGTSKPIVYRNLWATTQINEDRVTLQLLDDKANPTGITEEVGSAELAGRFVHKPVKPQVWEELKKKLLAGQRAAPPAKPKPQAKPQAQDSHQFLELPVVETCFLGSGLGWGLAWGLA